MSRDSNGNYSLPEADFVTGTTIEAGTMNSNLGDLETAITDSLDRNGKGGMLARLRGVDGTVAAPAFSFTSETDIGFYRAGSGDVRFADGAADLLKISASENRSLVAFKVTAGGATIDAGGLTVTAGGAVVTAGGLTVSAGGTNTTGSLGTNATVASAHIAASTGTMAATSGNTYPLFNARGTSTGANVVNFTARARNASAVTDWQQVDVGFSYDVDLTVGSGGSFYLGKNGAKLTGGTAATGADPTNALTLENGNLKLSGTAPNSDEATPNTLTPMLIPKAVALITFDGSANPTIVTGASANIASVSIVGSDARVTFATPFVNADFVVIPTCNLSAVTPTNPDTTAGTSRIDIARIGGGGFANGTLHLVAFGAQP